MSRPRPLAPSRHSLVLAALAAAALAASGASPVRAVEAYRLEETLVKTGDRGRDETTASRTWLAEGRMRKEEQGGSVTILRGDRKVVWVLDPVRKTWFEIDEAAMKRVGEMGMAVLGPDGGGDAASWLKRTGNRRKVGAWEAYEVRAEDRPVPGARLSLWLSPGVPIEPAFRDQFGSGGFGAGNPLSRVLGAIRDLEGYPVEVELEVRLGSQRLVVRQTLEKVEKVDAPDALFEIPAGYTRVDSPFAGLVGR